jgi:hypothetical protein
MQAWNQDTVAIRVRQLMDAKLGGDVARSAQFLGVTRAALECFLEGAPAEDCLYLLNAVTRRFEVDACWLLTGSDDLQLRQFSAEDRLQVARLLSQLSEAGIRERGARYYQLSSAPWSTV